MPAPTPAVPIYQRIISRVEKQIESGQLKPGDKLPSISELRAEYECSAPIVNKAIRVLEIRGLIVGRPGRGTYVAPRS